MPAATDLALVTGFWDPRTLGRERHPRTTDEYLRLFAQLHARVPWPIVVWVDPPWVDAVRAIVAGGAPGPRRVVARAFEDLPHARRRQAFASLRPFDNYDPRKDTLQFLIMMWSKSDLVVDAMDLDEFASPRWAWIDFGIAHVADLGGVDWRAIATLAPERVRLCTMRATAPAEIEDLAEFYRGNRGKIAGGFFTGGAEAMRGLRARFGRELEDMRAAGRLVSDEQILATLTARVPEAFERWYGDYAGILVNYTGIRRDVTTVLDALADCRQRSLCAIGTDIARRLIDAFRRGHVRLTPAETARLLHDGFICAYYVERPLAEELGSLLASLYHHGPAGFRRALDAWQPLVEQNLRFVGIELAAAPSADLPSWTDFAAHSE
jgi:hypothetical protein